MSLQDLEALPDDELKSFFESFDTVLISGDGTLWTREGPVLGASEALECLRQLEKQVVLVSNISTTGLDAVLRDTTQLQLGFKRDEIVIPSVVVFNYLKEIKFDKEVFVLGSPTLKGAFGSAGFVVSNPGPDTYKESLLELVNNVSDNANIGAIIFDFDLNLDYASFLKAVTYLQRPEVRFITMASDAKVTIGYDASVIGQKSFQMILESLSRKPPIKFGKPSINVANYIESTFKNEKAKTLYIGNSLDKDMPFAKRANYQSLLVLNTVATLEKAQNGNASIDYCVGCMENLHILINKYKNIKVQINTPAKK